MSINLATISNWQIPNEIDKLTPDDLATIENVLRQCIQENGHTVTEKVRTILEHMRWSLGGNSDYTYLVARNDEGEAIGLIGLRKLTDDNKLRQYSTQPGECLELINFYLHPDYMGQGFGYKLFLSVLKEAMRKGCKQLLWCSGIRFLEYGWAFYKKYVGEPNYIDSKFFAGENREDDSAAIWILTLVES